MRIILIGNYLPDKQESMHRFAQTLRSGFQAAGYDCEIWHPAVFVGKYIKNAHRGMSKWLGYVDKWLIFPLVIRWRLRRMDGETRFHICDHSNAIYLTDLPRNNTGITCHDVLAIRGALGYPDAHCPASSTGKLLQIWILRRLRGASRLAAVSQNTLNQLLALPSPTMNGTKPEKWQVIYNGFNAEFTPLAASVTNSALLKNGAQIGVPFLLHVGSSLPRKNRKLLLDMAVCLGSQWTGLLCFAGQPVGDELLTYAQRLGLSERIITIEEPNHTTLVALYNACSAFVFPSFSEGFGWPVIEAQACGAPVIASSIQPMPEIGGEAALYADPHNASEFAQAFLSLNDPKRRTHLIEAGFVNCRRFSTHRMTRQYLDLYGLTQPN